MENKNLIIEARTKFPFVSCNTNGILQIIGNSYMEESQEFYKVIHKWLDGYLLTPADKTTLICYIGYHNSSSSKSLLNLIRKIQEAKNDKAFNVLWLYDKEDESVQERGEDLRCLTLGDESKDFTLMVIDEGDLVNNKAIPEDFLKNLMSKN